MQLRVDARLPEGWRCTLTSPRKVRLKPGERRWIELAIERAGGKPVKGDEEDRYRVQVAGVIDGNVVGGISFYLAPPSAFPGRGRSEA
jgi:hypothetical protein